MCHLAVGAVVQTTPCLFSSSPSSMADGCRRLTDLRKPCAPHTQPCSAASLHRNSSAGTQRCLPLGTTQSSSEDATALSAPCHAEAPWNIVFCFCLFLNQSPGYRAAIPNPSNKTPWCEGVGVGLCDLSSGIPALGHSPGSPTPSHSPREAVAIPW